MSVREPSKGLGKGETKATRTEMGGVRNGSRQNRNNPREVKAAALCALAFFPMCVGGHTHA
jgi:hypothetical protein